MFNLKIVSMSYKIFSVVLLLLFSNCSGKTNSVNPVKPSAVKPKVETPEKQKIASAKVKSLDSKVESVYDKLDSGKYDLPNFVTFKEGMSGYYLLKEKGLLKKDVLTVIDFSLSSKEKRLWVIDLNTNIILFNCRVAHGRNTGEEYAKSFSNEDSSYKSSLGLYLTGETYTGKHGMSLRLDGLEKGINNNARARGVVIHSADYASKAFVNQNNRLGRSQGCPAISEKVLKGVVDAIKNKSCLFIHHPSRSYEPLPSLFF